jgi:hypothetical protein
MIRKQIGYCSEKIFLQLLLFSAYTTELWRMTFVYRIFGGMEQACLWVSSGHVGTPMITNRGCLAVTFTYLETRPPPKVCCVYGGRSLFLLRPGGISSITGKSIHHLMSGDCFIDGFEDEKELKWLGNWF